jgi:manganese/iron transport system permease protein
MSDFTELALLPFQLDFMRSAFIITLMIAVPMAILSCFLVLKGWSLMGDAVSHAVLPGIVIAYAVGLPLALGAFIAGLLCSIGTGFIKLNSRIKEDTVLGVVFSGMFAFGLVLFVKVESDLHLMHILFGDMLGITTRDLIETGLIALAACAFLLACRHDLLVQSFDAQHAQAIGLRTNLLHYGLLAVLSLVVVGALQAIGIILSIALLIAPGATAFLISRRFSTMMITAVVASTISTVLGIWLSFMIDSAPAPTIVLIMTALFIAAFIRSNLEEKRRSASISDAA